MYKIIKILHANNSSEFLSNEFKAFVWKDP